VGRPGLEPGTYGLKAPSTLDDFQELTPGPHHSPTILEQRADSASLAAELLEAQQAGDSRWIELARQLAAVARDESFAAHRHEFARFATELAERVLLLAAEPTSERNGMRR